MNLLVFIVLLYGAQQEWKSQENPKFQPGMLLNLAGFLAYNYVLQQHDLRRLTLLYEWMNCIAQDLSCVSKQATGNLTHLTTVRAAVLADV